MGSLITISLDDRFDKEVLFESLLDADCGIADMARLACTCRLAMSWARAHVGKATRHDLRRLVINLPLWALTTFDNDGKERPVAVPAASRFLAQQPRPHGRIMWWRTHTGMLHFDTNAGRTTIRQWIATITRYDTDATIANRGTDLYVTWPVLRTWVDSTTSDTGIAEDVAFPCPWAGFAVFPAFDAAVLHALRSTARPPAWDADAQDMNEDLRAVKRARIEQT